MTPLEPTPPPADPTLADCPRTSRLDAPMPPPPRLTTNVHDVALRAPCVADMNASPDVKRSDSLSVPEVRLLQAWRQLRALNPWQQPTMSELAHVLALSPSTVAVCVTRLCAKGVLVRVHHHRRRGRCYALTPEAAARPHLGALVRLATDVVKLKPRAQHGDEHDSQYAALWARAHAVVQEIVNLASQKQRKSARVARMEAEDAARSGAQSSSS